MTTRSMIRPRPERRQKVDRAIVTRILQVTAKEAVGVPLNGDPVNNVRSRYRSHMLLRHRVVIGSKLVGDELRIWVERRL